MKKTQKNGMKIVKQSDMNIVKLWSSELVRKFKERSVYTMLRSEVSDIATGNQDHAILELTGAPPVLELAKRYALVLKLYKKHAKLAKFVHKDSCNYPTILVEYCDKRYAISPHGKVTLLHGVTKEVDKQGDNI